VLDTEMGRLGGTVFRRSADAVLADLEAAEEAYRAAEKEADRAAREQRKAERKEDFEQRKAALKAKLGIE
jgi:class 3 adenylate cyclase